MFCCCSWDQTEIISAQTAPIPRGSLKRLIDVTATFEGLSQSHQWWRKWWLRHDWNREATVARHPESDLLATAPAAESVCRSWTGCCLGRAQRTRELLPSLTTGLKEIHRCQKCKSWIHTVAFRVNGKSGLTSTQTTFYQEVRLRLWDWRPHSVMCLHQSDLHCHCSSVRFYSNRWLQWDVHLFLNSRLSGRKSFFGMLITQSQCKEKTEVTAK